MWTYSDFSMKLLFKDVWGNGKSVNLIWDLICPYTLCVVVMVQEINGICMSYADDALTWMDGSALAYSNWASKVPDASVLRADTCVSTRIADAEWLLTSCGNKLGFICKTHSGTFNTCISVAEMGT